MASKHIYSIAMPSHKIHFPLISCQLNGKIKCVVLFLLESFSYIMSLIWHQFSFFFVAPVVVVRAVDASYIIYTTGVCNKC